MATIEQAPPTHDVTSIDVSSPLQNLLARAYALDWVTIFYVTVFVLAVLTRFINLGDRVMSHDESLHVKFSYDLWKTGVFQHTPLMHGPVLFHMTALMYTLFGDSDFSGRLYPAILGIIMVMMPKLLFERWLGRRGAMVASILLLISPMVLFHSRYIREDTPSIFFTLLMVYGIFAYLDGVQPRQIRYLIVLSAATLLGLASKETGFMYIAVFGLVLTIYWLIQLVQGLRSGKTNPIVGWTIGLVIAALGVGAVSVLVGAKLSSIFSASGTQISGIILAIPVFLILCVAGWVLVTPIRALLGEIGQRANSMFKLVLTGMIVGTIAALAMTCILHLITEQNIQSAQIAWQNYDASVAQLQPGQSAPPQPNDPRPEALQARLIEWTTLVAALLALAVIGTALVKFSRSPRLPWADIAIIAVIAIVFCTALVTFEEASFNMSKPDTGDTTSASTGPYNDFWLLPVWVAGLAACGGIVYLRYRTPFFEELKAYPVFDVLIVLGSLILPWLSAIPMYRAGYPLDSNFWSAEMVRSGILYTVPFIAVAVTAGLCWNPTAWIACAATFYSIFAFFYTTIFTNINGIATGLVGSLGYWLVQQGVRRGSQPQYYYLLVELPAYEYLPVIGAIIAGIVGLFELWRFRAERFLAVDKRKRQPEMIEAPEGVVEQPVDVPMDQAVTQISAANATQVEITTPEMPDDTPVDVEPIVLEQPEIAEAEWLERVPFLGFVGVWAVMIIMAFTMAGEKMPWLTTHLTIPLILVTGWYIGTLLDKVDWSAFFKRSWALIVLTPILGIALANVIGPYVFGARPFGGLERDDLLRTFTWFGAILVTGLLVYGIYRIWRHIGLTQTVWVGLLGIFVLLTLMTARTAWLAAYINYDYATEFMVYAHGAPAVKQVMTMIDEISKRTTDGLNAKIAYDDKVSWPGSWYFRNYPAGSFKGDLSGVTNLDENVAIVVGDDHAAKVESLVGDKYYKFNYIRLWWPMQDYFDLNMSRIDNVFGVGVNPQNLPGGWVDPAALRQGLWNIWWNRDYSAYAKATNKNLDVSQWPVADRMDVYIRKDVAAQIWNFGTGSTKIASLPEDPFKTLHCEACASNAVFAGQGDQQGQLNHPRKIAAGPDGNVYVIDSQNSRVAIFSPDGTFLRQFGSYGSVDQAAPGGTFREPWGVAVGQDGQIYIADTWNHRVEVFDSKGAFVRMWGQFEQVQPGTTGKPDGFWGPRDIAVDNQNHVYVADTGNKRVRVYDEKGTFLYDIGQGGSGQGQLDEPVGLAINDATNEIFVADTWNRRIDVFDLTGAFRRSWDVQAWSATRDTGNRPYLALDKAGTHLFVTDPDAARVLIFDTNGVPILSFGNPGTAPLSANQFASLGGVAIGQNDTIFVADAGSGRVLRFDPNTLPGLIPPQPILSSNGVQQPTKTHDDF